MFYNFKHSVVVTWNLWCGLFDPIPYGDPYIATFVLVAIMAAAVKFFVGGESA